jgi:hypothetical protein
MLHGLEGNAGISRIFRNIKSPKPMNPNSPDSNYSISKSSNAGFLDRSQAGFLRLLQREDWDFWKENGYVVIPGVIPKKQATRTADFLWEYEGKDPKNPETWYRKTVPDMEMSELVNTGMVEVYHHQYLWDNRQNPKVHAAFADIWGSEKLWVTIDRANLNFPIRKDYQYKGFIHWDYDPVTKPQNVQGVLALNDQLDENVGGFQCVPEIFRDFESWRAQQPADWKYFQPDVSGYKLTKVPLQAGDLLIFHSQLPHGIRENRSPDKVRIAQYISMMPAEPENHALRDWRIQSWQNREALKGYAFPGDPMQREKRFPVAELSDLGKKLLGLEDWEP